MPEQEKSELVPSLALCRPHNFVTNIQPLDKLLRRVEMVQVSEDA